MALGHAAGPTRNPVDHLEETRSSSASASKSHLANPAALLVPAAVPLFVKHGA